MSGIIADLTRDFEVSSRGMNAIEIARKLKGLEKFREDEMSVSRSVVKVGSELKFRMIGVLMGQKYIGPTTVTITVEGDAAKVDLKGTFVVGEIPALRRFYDRTFDEIEALIRAD